MGRGGGVYNGDDDIYNNRGDSEISADRDSHLAAKCNGGTDTGIGIIACSDISDGGGIFNNKDITGVRDGTEWDNGGKWVRGVNGVIWGNSGDISK